MNKISKVERLMKSWKANELSAQKLGAKKAESIAKGIAMGLGLALDVFTDASRKKCECFDKRKAECGYNKKGCCVHPSAITPPKTD